MKYDLIIVGGGTSGCACAYTAGKLGLKTLLIEKNSFLGGTMTSALVMPAMNTKTNLNLNTDFYEELMKNLKEIGGQITYPDGNIGWFNPELMKIVLDNMLSIANVDVLLGTEINEVVHNKEMILGITLNHLNIKNLVCNDSIYTNKQFLNNKILSEYIETKYIVDATGDAKIFEKINLKFLNNFEKNLENVFQPASLRFIMSGVNLKTFSDWLTEIDKDRDVTSVYTIDDQIHLSTAYTWDTERNWALKEVFRDGINQGLITVNDSNYFQLFTIPGMPSAVAFNCPRILENVDTADKIAYSMALKQGRESIFRLSRFMKTMFKGFENSYISSIANTLGIRVSNRIIGKYIYTIDDLRSGKKFENPVLISKYPVDVHSKEKDNSLLETQEQEYMLPIESLISADYDNLFAIGRCLSADFYAQGALRIIPCCFSMGEGVAKYLSGKIKQ